VIGLCGEVAVGAEVLEGGVALQDAGYLVLEDKEGAVALLHGHQLVAGPHPAVQTAGAAARLPLLRDPLPDQVPREDEGAILREDEAEETAGVVEEDHLLQGEDEHLREVEVLLANHTHENRDPNLQK
jgi:hypothetical protein